MMEYETRVEAEIVGRNVRAQVNLTYWPETGEQNVIFDRDAYIVARRLDAAPAVWLDADDSHTLGRCGVLLLMPPKFPIRLRIAPGWYKTFSCFFEPAILEKTINIRADWDEAAMGQFFDIKRPFLEALMERMQEEVARPGFVSGPLIEAAGNLILAEFASYSNQIRVKPSVTHNNRASGLRSWQLSRIYQRIESSLELGCPSLEELAALCGLSQFHMMRQFKVSTGITVHKYVENVRLESAKRMLSNEDRSVKEIAFLLGFSSQRYFSAAFRRLAAITPAEFRARTRSASYEARSATIRRRRGTRQCGSPPR